MTSKISFWPLLRLAVLLAAFLVQSSQGATYRDFAWRHINHPKTRANNNNAYCNLMMQQRGMTQRSCKSTNTFINEPAGTVQHVCRGGGRLVNRNIYRSTRRFRVVTCRSTGRYPNCRYSGRIARRRIKVGCVNRQPVHFDGLA